MTHRTEIAAAENELQELRARRLMTVGHTKRQRIDERIAQAEQRLAALRAFVPNGTAEVPATLTLNDWYDCCNALLTEVARARSEGRDCTADTLSRVADKVEQLIDAERTLQFDLAQEAAE